MEAHKDDLKNHASTLTETNIKTSIEPPMTSSIPVDDNHTTPKVSRPSGIDDGNSETASVYSYFSTWSTNYTMSNLPGPGRILGNLFSAAGSTLERNFGRFVMKSRMKAYRRAVKALTKLPFWRVGEMTPGERQETCKLLLYYAQSEDANIQTSAFRLIILCVVRWPPFREDFQSYCKAQGEDIESVTHSWTTTSNSFSAEWNYICQVASLCFRSNPVMDYVASRNLKYRSSDFTCVEELFTCCRDIFEAALALELVGWLWNGEGLEEFLMSDRDRGRVTLRFAFSIRTRFDMAVSGCSGLSSNDVWFDNVVRIFIQEMWNSGEALTSSKECETLVEDPDRLAAWSELYMIYIRPYKVLLGRN
ncbi:hypothetical protein SCHPADRAFT_525645 [Schizopora paradoxa]|uniref:Uncharacterized protein n=1 Tax=Schizopora paradoxa TaxID=27342 RepID=A0A0H2REN8_9AGAM|nr:hypothetical protein SCHPADRAFT_525645 [Schizopora paradoxa]